MKAFANDAANGSGIFHLRSFCGILALGLLTPGDSIEGAEKPLALVVSTALEYDDNVTLLTTSGNGTEGDLVWRLGPELNLRWPWQDHDLKLDLSADYRRGLDTGIADFDLAATAGVNLNFAGGLQVNFSQSYSQTRFDPELREDTGTPDNDVHQIQLAASYPFGQRLKLEASYRRQAQDFDLEDRATVERGIENAEGTLFIPITRSAVARVSYALEHQDSPERPDRAYRNNSYRLGLSWDTPHRLSLQLEIGEGSLDFELPEQQDFDGIVTLIGARLKLTERTSAELRVGRDEFGELSYDGGLTFQSDTDFSAGLSFSRQTRPSFSFVFESVIKHSERIALSVSDRLANRFAVSLSVDYQLQESAFSVERRDDELFNGSLEVSYPLRHGLDLGGHYRYARRTSNASFDFVGRRFGFDVTFRL